MLRWLSWVSRCSVYPVATPHLLPADHLLTADPAEAHDLHSLTSVVDSIGMEDVSVAFPDEAMPR